MAELKLNVVLGNINKLKKSIESSFTPKGGSPTNTGGGILKGINDRLKELKNLQEMAKSLDELQKINKEIAGLNKQRAKLTGDKGGGIGIKGAALLGVIAGGIIGILKNVQVVQDLLGVVGGLINQLVAPFVPFLITVLKPVMVVLNALAALMFAFFQDPVGVIKKGLEAITGKVAELLGIDPAKFKDFIDSVVNYLEKLKALWKLIVDFLTKLFSGDLIGAFKLLLPILLAAWELLKSILISAWETLKALLLVVWELLKDVFVIIWEALKNTFLAAWETLKDFGQWIWDTIVSVLSTGWEVLKTIGQWIWDSLVSVFTSAFNVLKNIGSWIKDKIMGLFGGGGGKSESVGDAILRPDGSVIKTDPRDFLIATKNPASLGGGGGMQININIQGNADRSTVDEVIRRLRQELVRRGV